MNDKNKIILFSIFVIILVVFIVLGYKNYNKGYNDFVSCITQRIDVVSVCSKGYNTTWGEMNCYCTGITVSHDCRCNINCKSNITIENVGRINEYQTLYPEDSLIKYCNEEMKK